MNFNVEDPIEHVFILSGVNQCQFLTGIRIGDCQLMFVERTAIWNRLLGMTKYVHL